MNKFRIMNISIIAVVMVLTTVVVMDSQKSQTIPASHLMNSGHSLEKCDVLLETGFYAKVGHLQTNEKNSVEDQLWMHGLCIEITEHILSKDTN